MVSALNYAAFLAGSLSVFLRRCSVERYGRLMAKRADMLKERHLILSVKHYSSFDADQELYSIIGSSK